MGTNFNVPRGIPLKPITRPVNTPLQKTPDKSNEFSEILSQKLESSSLKFSAHAQKRLNANGIKLSAQQIQQLEDAVNKLATKGGKESLVIMKDLAFVVSVANKTVITAIDNARMEENVFTNIDSAVIS